MEFCWKIKYFPTVWKNGITVLIYKKLDPAFANDPANFRPILLHLFETVFTVTYLKIIILTAISKKASGKVYLELSNILSLCPT